MDRNLPFLECTTNPLLNQNVSFSQVANNNRHLPSDQISSRIMGNEICCDTMKISCGTSASSAAQGREGPKSTAKHIGSD